MQVLGKRLGKAMKPVGEAIKALTREQIAEFERSGLLTVQGHELEEGDLKVGICILGGFFGTGVIEEGMVMLSSYSKQLRGG